MIGFMFKWCMCVFVCFCVQMFVWHERLLGRKELMCGRGSYIKKGHILANYFCFTQVYYVFFLFSFFLVGMFFIVP